MKIDVSNKEGRVKILHIGKYYPPFHGGIENFMCSLMEQQKLEGHQVSAIVHHHIKKQAFVEQKINGVNVYRIPLLGQLLYTPISPSFGYYLNKIIKKENPDIIHIHTPNLSAFWCLIFPSVRKLPWVIQWQSDVIGAVPDIKIKLLYPFYSVLEKMMLNQTSKIIVATPSYAKTSIPLKKYYPKVEVVPLALSESLLEKSDNSNNNRRDSVVNLLVIGRLTYYKGHNLLIRAIGKLKKQDVHFTLNIVGDGELKDIIQAEINFLKLNENIKLLGKLSDEELAEKLEETDLLCLPSIERTEAFGVVLLEAMRASKPCLVTDVVGSGMSWVVQDNTTGFVVKYNDVGALVDKLSYISKNQELLRQYGLAGKQRFDKEFCISSVSSKIYRIYEESLLR
jgi:rhamnosyl/mannosyltransferase